MASLNQFAWVAGTSVYRFGHNSIPNIPISNFPPDADLSRWAMLHDGSAYRFYAFRRGSNDTIYQGSFDGSAYVFGHNSIPVLRLVDFPADSDASSFAMLHDGSAYRLYLRRAGDPRTLYQSSWVEGTDMYRFGHNSIPAIPVTGFPDDTDWSRWMMLHDGSAYRHYAFKQGSDTQFYQGSFNRPNSAYEYAFNSIPVLTLEGTPADSDTSHASMLHDRSDYRFYFQVKQVAPPNPDPDPEPNPNPNPPTKFSERGAFVTPILNVSDVNASVAWFQKLGWSLAYAFGDSFACLRFGWGQLFLSRDSQGLRGGNPVGPGVGDDAGATWHCWWMASPAEVDLVHRLAIDAGVIVVSPPENKPWGERELRIAHPEGHVIRVTATL